jgi:hypothetical protein
MKTIIASLLLTIFFTVSLLKPFSQETGGSEGGVSGETAAGDESSDDEAARDETARDETAKDEAFEDLPRGFRNIRLGMSLDEVKEELQRDSYFVYRGEPDVSMLARPDSALIEVTGFLYIDRAFFQFDEERLFTLIIRLNRDELDYYSLYTQLTGKYGDPRSLDPEQVIWENDSVRLSLERPLSVKYIDMETFNRIRESAETEESFKAASRQEFLDMF